MSETEREFSLVEVDFSFKLLRYKSGKRKDQANRWPVRHTYAEGLSGDLNSRLEGKTPQEQSMWMKDAYDQGYVPETDHEIVDAYTDYNGDPQAFTTDDGYSFAKGPDGNWGPNTLDMHVPASSIPPLGMGDG